MRIFLPLLFSAFAPAALAQSMQPGEWEFSSTLSGAMLPKPQSAKVTQCVSAEDAKDPTRFTSGEHTQGCTMTPGARTPDSYQWALDCPEQGVRGEGKLRYTPRSIEAEIRTTVTKGAEKIELLSRVSGRLLGPCRTK
jgi:hypothetical protein